MMMKMLEWIGNSLLGRLVIYNSDYLSTLIKIETHIESGNKPYNDEFDLCFLEDVKYSLSDVLSRWE